jgi:predicted secreted hydrolase
VIQLLGDVNYEYAFPAMRTVGTLNVKGRTRRVSGVSWLDRQWGPVPVQHPSMRWTWMNITLRNGDQPALWDVLDKRLRAPGSPRSARTAPTRSRRSGRSPPAPAGSGPAR